MTAFNHQYQNMSLTSTIVYLDGMMHPKGPQYSKHIHKRSYNLTRRDKPTVGPVQCTCY